MTGDHSDLGQALEFIDPAKLGYQEWLEVGMALHDSGYPCELWETWSRRDPARFVEGECARKWAGFGSGDGRVTGATVARMARDRGWVPSREGPGTALAWDGEVDVSGIVDPAWVEPEEIPDGPSDPVRELSAYLSALFGAEEVVGYVCESLERDGRHIPANKGTYTRTCGELLRDLERYGSIERALGAYDPEAGAWVRFNPLNGQGVRNSDVADFRYALVESDSLPKDRQLALVRALELPCAAVVDSGGKSVHAIVRVDARDYAEYRQRVDQLYEVCRRNGLEPDPQNKNPSRLSRMPGARRGDAQQRLLSGPCGRATWGEWWEWVQVTSDDLPDPDNLASVWGDMPELAPPLIEGVLRQGHKMMLAGPSKAGKSFALIELCCAIAEGREWLGRRCAQGRVLYVNLELDPASALRRFRDVYDALGWEPASVANIDVWNLRGRAVPMDRLAPSLIRRALRVRPIAVVIDPIYKVITGDENSADQMAAFCNQFDRVAQQVGCAVIYCHHHSKGFQGNKRSMDRASGSGVFARDTDALLDMAPLEVTDACREERSSRLRWAAAEAFLSREMPDWRDRVPADEQASVEALLTWSTRGLPRARAEALSESVRAASRGFSSWTAWRIEGTLREFPGFPPVNVWFSYPVHLADDTGALADLSPEGEPDARSRQRRGTRAAQGARRDEQRERVRMMRDAITSLREEGLPATREAVIDRIETLEGVTVSREQIKSWTVSRTKWSPIRVAGDGSNELVDTSDSALDFDGEA